MPQIKSRKEPVIKLLDALQKPTGRHKHGRFIAEGIAMIRRAFSYGAKVDALFVSNAFVQEEEWLTLMEEISSFGGPIYTLTMGLLSKTLTSAKPSPPCIAVVSKAHYTLDHVLEGVVKKGSEPALLIGVDRGELADNLGMLLRSTEAAGVHAALLSPDTVDPYGRRVIRGSRGAVFHLPLLNEEPMEDMISSAQTKGIQVIATSAHTETSYTKPDYTRPTLMLIGNEHVGIRKELVSLADTCVRIPMLGRINSLNIAVAASLMVYEARRQRMA